MRAYRVIEADGEARAFVDDTVSIPHDGEVDVALQWSGINQKDAMVVSSHSRVRRSSNLIAGVDGAGVVTRSTEAAIPVGSLVAVHGDEVGVGRDGCFAEAVSVPASVVSVLPGPIDPRTAMVLGTAGFTAMQSVLALEHHGLSRDGELLVTGATGGVGSWAVQLLSSRGYRVVASTGSAHEHEWLRARGASRVIGRDAIGDRDDRVLGSERWAGAVDCVGGETLHQVLRTLAYGCGVAASGLVGSNQLSTTVYPFITRGVNLLGIDAVRVGADTRQRVWRALADAVEHVDLDAMIDSTVGLDGLGPALNTIREGRTRGRILVRLR